MTIARPVRWRIIRLLKAGCNCRTIYNGGLFAPSRATVYRVRRRYLQFSDVRTPANGRRPRRKGVIPPSVLEELIDHLVTVDSTLYLDEMTERIFQQTGAIYTPDNIGRALRRNGLVRKVLSKIAARRCPFERASYHYYMGDYRTHHVVCIDETRKDPRTLYRTHGRTYRFLRALAKHDFTRASRGYSALGVLTVDGMIDHAITRANGVVADRFVNDFWYHVLPHLNAWPGPRSVVVLDNASIHLDPRILAMVRSVGAVIVPLPAWSYDLNPIEKAFSKVKAWLRRHRSYATARPRAALSAALSAVSARDARGYFRSCGWEV